MERGHKVITVTIKEGEITIDGHAGYAPIGQDIVCAAISALTETFLASVRIYTTDKINSVISAGNAVIRYKDLSADSRLLMKSFLLGVTEIAIAYPDNVKVIGASIDTP